MEEDEDRMGKYISTNCMASGVVGVDVVMQDQKETNGVAIRRK